MAAAVGTHYPVLSDAQVRRLEFTIFGKQVKGDAGRFLREYAVTLKVLAEKIGVPLDEASLENLVGRTIEPLLASRGEVGEARFVMHQAAGDPLIQMCEEALKGPIQRKIFTLLHEAGLLGDAVAASLRPTIESWNDPAPPVISAFLTSDPEPSVEEVKALMKAFSPEALIIYAVKLPSSKALRRVFCFPDWSGTVRDTFALGHICPLTFLPALLRNPSNDTLRFLIGDEIAGKRMISFLLEPYHRFVDEFPEKFTVAFLRTCEVHSNELVARFREHHLMTPEILRLGFIRAVESGNNELVNALLEDETIRGFLAPEPVEINPHHFNFVPPEDEA